MRKFILILALFSIGRVSAQQTDKTYYFKELGWSIVLPSDFTVSDSADEAARLQRGKKAIEEANNVKADVSATRTLLGATKNKLNYFNVTVTPFDPQQDGDYLSAGQQVKDILYATFAEKAPDLKIDSSSTTVNIGGLSFDRFHLFLSMGDKGAFHMFMLSKLYKGYDFGICYLYLDEETKQQIETMLANSKFVK
jgi:hypothetical protein